MEDVATQVFEQNPALTDQATEEAWNMTQHDRLSLSCKRSHCRYIVEAEKRTCEDDEYARGVIISDRGSRRYTNLF